MIVKLQMREFVHIVGLTIKNTVYVHDTNKYNKQQMLTYKPRLTTK